MQKAYLPECALTHPRLTQHNLRFTSGWEEFFNDVCRVTLSLWSNPWSSPTAEYWHPEDTGGLGIDNQTPLLQVLNSVTAGSACFINTADCPDVSDEVFRILNRKMRSFEDFRLVCVTKRDASSRWNSFLQTWEPKGRAALCGAVRFMNFRTYGVHKETWSRLNGPWEVYILESGIKPVGHLLSAHDYSTSLRNLVGGKSNSEWFPLPSFSDGYAYKGHSGFRPSDVQSFWDAWDEIALKRDALLKSKPVDWSAVCDSLQESNLLLRDAKDTRLRRIARLAKLPLTWCLDEVGSWVYTICGPYPPYVGQTGCFKNTRSCLDRYREHLQKAKSPANHFSGIRHRKIRAATGFGKLPSLARMLAREGPSRVTIVALQDVANKQAGAVERWWNTVLGQTLNQVTPFGGIDAFRVERLLGGHSKTISMEKASLTTMAQSLLREDACKSNREMDERWWFLSCVAGKIEPTLFERLFKHIAKLTKHKWDLTVRLRLVLRIPCFDPLVQTQVRGVCTVAMTKLMIPAGLKEWFAKSICVIPVPFATIRDALSAGGSQRAPKITRQILEEWRASEPEICEWVPLPHKLGAWRVQMAPDQLRQVCDEALRRVNQQSCHCTYMRRGAPNFGGYLDHVVIRTQSDWSHILEPTAVRIFFANTRNQFFPDPGTLREQLSDMRTALEGLAVSQISVERCQFVSKGIFEGGVVRQAESSLWEAVKAKVTTGIQAAPWLNGAQIQGLRYDVSELNLKVTVWDKKLTRLGALCSHLYDIRLLESTIFGSRFQLWGWAESPAATNLAVTYLVTQRAREHKILQDMLQRRLGRACLGLQEDADEFLFECFMEPLPNKRYPKAPALFSLPKWKSTEYDPENPVLKWRDIVSYKSHILQSYSRVVSRALQLLCAALHSSGVCLGFPNMLGVRDQLKSAQTICWST